MTILWLDGFDEYANYAEMEQRGYLDVRESEGAIASSPVRTGEKSLKVQRNTGTGPNARPGFIRKFFGDPDLEEVVVGFALHPIGNAVRGAFCSLGHDTGLNQYLRHLTFERNTLNGVTVLRGNNSSIGGVLIGSSKPEVLPLSAWHFVEIKVKISELDGEVIVRVNNEEVFNQCNIDTSNTSDPLQKFVNICEFEQDDDQYTLPTLANDANYYDDFYIASTEGIVNNDFIGDSRVFTLRPNGDGAFSQLSVFGAANNYQAVDDLQQDGDTTYVYSNTVGNKDTYTADNLPSGILEVFGVQVSTHAKKEEAGPKDFKNIIRLSGVETLGEINYPGITYETFWTVYESKPTGGSWTPTDIDNMEIGLQIAAQ